MVDKVHIFWEGHKMFLLDLEARAKILKKFVAFLVETMTSKSPSEINWPLNKEILLFWGLKSAVYSQERVLMARLLYMNFEILIQKQLLGVLSHFYAQKMMSTFLLRIYVTSKVKPTQHIQQKQNHHFCAHKKDQVPWNCFCVSMLHLQSPDV